MKRQLLVVIVCIGLGLNAFAGVLCYYNKIFPCQGTMLISKTVIVNGVEEELSCTGSTSDSRIQAIGTSNTSGTYAGHTLMWQPCNFHCYATDSSGEEHLLSDQTSHPFPVAYGTACNAS